MGFYHAAKGAVHGVARVAEYLGWVILLGWAALLTVGTIARYVFRYPLLFQVDVASVMLVLLCCLCFAPVFLQGDHIRVDLITRRLPERAQNLLWLFSELIVMIYAVLVAASTVPLIVHSVEIGSRLVVSGIIAWPFQIFIPIGLCTLALVVLVDFCDRCCRLFGKD